MAASSSPSATSSCSTLSDEDPTPNVSRSNSYGRPEESPAALSVAPPPAAAVRYLNDGSGAYDIYLRDDQLKVSHHLSTVSPSTVVVAPSPSPSSVGGGGVFTPPGYEETITRQRLLKNYNRSASFVVSPSSPTTAASSTPAKTHLVFEDGMKVIYHDGMSAAVPPPLPPKTERPPLPPKQRIVRLVEDTYANSEELHRFQQQIQQQQQEEERQHLVYPNYTAAGARIQIGQSNNSRSGRPSLPPKEKESSTAASSSSSPKKRSVTKIVASTQTRTTRNAETQTDETDFYLMYNEDDEEWQDEDEDEDVELLADPEDFAEHIHHFHHQHHQHHPVDRSLTPECYNRGVATSRAVVSRIPVPEYLHMTRSGDASRPHPRQQQQRPVSAPRMQQASPSPSPVSTGAVELRQAGRRRLEPVQSVPIKSQKQQQPAAAAGVKVDPIIQVKPKHNLFIDAKMTMAMIKHMTITLTYCFLL